MRFKLFVLALFLVNLNYSQTIREFLKNPGPGDTFTFTLNDTLNSVSYETIYRALKASGLTWDSEVPEGKAWFIKASKANHPDKGGSTELMADIGNLKDLFATKGSFTKKGSAQQAGPSGYSNQGTSHQYPGWQSSHQGYSQQNYSQHSTPSSAEIENWIKKGDDANLLINLETLERIDPFIKLSTLGKSLAHYMDDPYILPDVKVVIKKAIISYAIYAIEKDQFGMFIKLVPKYVAIDDESNVGHIKIIDIAKFHKRARFTYYCENPQDQLTIKLAYILKNNLLDEFTDFLLNPEIDKIDLTKKIPFLDNNSILDLYKDNNTNHYIKQALRNTILKYYIAQDDVAKFSSLVPNIFKPSEITQSLHNAHKIYSYLSTLNSKQDHSQQKPASNDQIEDWIIKGDHASLLRDLKTLSTTNPFIKLSTYGKSLTDYMIDPYISNEVKAVIKKALISYALFTIENDHFRAFIHLVPEYVKLDDRSNKENRPIIDIVKHINKPNFTYYCENPQDQITIKLAYIIKNNLRTDLNDLIRTIDINKIDLTKKIPFLGGESILDLYESYPTNTDIKPDLKRYIFSNILLNSMQQDDIVKFSQLVPRVFKPNEINKAYIIGPKIRTYLSLTDKGSSTNFLLQEYIKAGYLNGIKEIDLPRPYFEISSDRKTLIDYINDPHISVDVKNYLISKIIDNVSRNSDWSFFDKIKSINIDLLKNLLSNESIKKNTMLEIHLQRFLISQVVKAIETKNITAFKMLIPKYVNLSDRFNNRTLESILKYHSERYGGLDEFNAYIKKLSEPDFLSEADWRVLNTAIENKNQDLLELLLQSNPDILEYKIKDKSISVADYIQLNTDRNSELYKVFEKFLNKKLEEIKGKSTQAFNDYMFNKTANDIKSRNIAQRIFNKIRSNDSEALNRHKPGYKEIDVQNANKAQEDKHKKSYNEYARRYNSLALLNQDNHSFLEVIR